MREVVLWNSEIELAPWASTGAWLQLILWALVGSAVAVGCAEVTPGPILAEVPFIESVSPDSVLWLSGDMEIIITGIGFHPESVVSWRGSPNRLRGVLPATVVSSQQIVVTFVREITVSPQTGTLSVYTPPPGGGTATVPFRIVSPSP